MIDKAMILAAGLGTRLGNITQQKPKALVPIQGIPMLEFTLLRLMQKGIRKFVINIHHHADQVLKFLDKAQFDAEIQISDERDQLLDTGGAIKKAAEFFNPSDNILVHNVDVVSDLDVEKLEQYHQKNQASVTLCVRKRASGRALLFDKEMQLTGWTNHKTQDFKWVNDATSEYSSFAFNGIYLMRGAFAHSILDTGRFSIIDTWLKMAKDHRILAFEDLSETWFDLGTAEKIAAAEKHLTKKNNS